MASGERRASAGPGVAQRCRLVPRQETHVRSRAAAGLLLRGPCPATAPQDEHEQADEEAAEHEAHDDDAQDSEGDLSLCGGPEHLRQARYRAPPAAASAGASTTSVIAARRPGRLAQRPRA